MIEDEDFEPGIIEAPTESSNEITDAAADPDFDYTQNLRKRVVDKLLEQSMGDVPTDKDSVLILKDFLDGIDKQVVAKKRIRIANKDSQTNANVAKLLEEMSRKRNTGEAIEIDVTPSPVALPRSAALSGNWLPEPVVVSGELNTEHSQETPDQFFERMERDNPELLNGSNIKEDD